MLSSDIFQLLFFTISSQPIASTFKVVFWKQWLQSAALHVHRLRDVGLSMPEQWVPTEAMGNQRDLTIVELFLVQVLSSVLDVDQLHNTIWPSHNRIEIAATNG